MFGLKYKYLAEGSTKIQSASHEEEVQQPDGTSKTPRAIHI